MKKLLLLLLLLSVFSSIDILGQKSGEITIDVKTIHMTTDRTTRNNGQGQFQLEAVDETGSKFTRDSIDGSFFIAPALNCDFCKKGSVFPAYSGGNWNWRTGGNSTDLTENTRIMGKITIPKISLPVRHPRFKPLFINVPLNLENELKIVDQSDPNKIKTYIDPKVDLTGYMRLEYKQDRADPTTFYWVRAEINLYKIEENIFQNKINLLRQFFKLQ